MNGSIKDKVKSCMIVGGGRIRSDCIISLKYLATNSMFAYVRSLDSTNSIIEAMVGYMENFWLFSDFSKCVLSFDMLLGRPECLPMMILFVPAVWNKRL